MHDHGLTVSDFEILQQLYAAGDEMVRMHQLAEEVHLTQSALSRLITRLEKAGLVNRGTCEDDRRSVWTQITEAGRTRYLAARPTQRLILKQYSDGGELALGECVDADADAGSELVLGRRCPVYGPAVVLLDDMDFEALISEEQAGLTRRLARSLGGDFGTAEDLWQELTIRAWRRLPRDADHNAQRAWLRRTATNLTVDELRRRGRRPTTALDDAAELAVEGAGEPDAAREALTRLSAHERLLLLLRFDAGLQHAEVAAVLDISEDAARKRTERARKQFVRAYRAARSDGPPLIIVTARDRNPHNYVSWLEQAGARVRLKDEAPTERELALADGVVFGGDFDDIHSELYGEAPRALRGNTDLTRDRADLAVVSSVLALELPYVGICRGHQLLNIATGGDLYQDVVLDGVAAGSHDIGLHRIETPADSSARSLIGRSADVVSEHHQAVRRLGRRMRVASLSPDGVIESIEHQGARFAMGLQWHPEETPGEAGTRIAEALVAAALKEAA